MGEDAAAAAAAQIAARVKAEPGAQPVASTSKAMAAAEPELPRRGGKFQSKTRRIEQSEESAETLRMRREERDPWLLEDARPLTSARSERWTGRLEGTAGQGEASTSHYVLLVLDKASSNFKVIPAHRVYNFTKRPNRVTLSAEEADVEVCELSLPLAYTWPRAPRTVCQAHAVLLVRSHRHRTRQDRAGPRAAREQGDGLAGPRR
jgi:hypothetical protein